MTSELCNVSRLTRGAADEGSTLFFINESIEKMRAINGTVRGGNRKGALSVEREIKDIINVFLRV